MRVKPILEGVEQHWNAIHIRDDAKVHLIHVATSEAHSTLGVEDRLHLGLEDAVFELHVAHGQLAHKRIG